jgi:PHD/YefM family antitoxin component YafN of YafNO toxin-antitoxin module
MDAAQKEPVSVEKTGRPYVVIVSTEEHDRLKAYEDAYWAARAREAKESGVLGPEATIATRRMDSGEFRIVYSFYQDTVFIELVVKRNDNEIYRDLRHKRKG